MIFRGNKWQARGGFAPTAHYFLSVGGVFQDFLWQDASVEVEKDMDGQVVSWHVTAGTANLYSGGDAAFPEDFDSEGLALALDVVVVPSAP